MKKTFILMAYIIIFSTLAFASELKDNSKEKTVPIYISPGKNLEKRRMELGNEAVKPMCSGEMGAILEGKTS